MQYALITFIPTCAQGGGGEVSVPLDKRLAAVRVLRLGGGGWADAPGGRSGGAGAVTAGSAGAGARKASYRQVGSFLHHADNLLQTD